MTEEALDKVGSRLARKEQAHYLLVAEQAGDTQRRSAILLDRVDAGAAVLQQARDLSVALLAGEVQRRSTILLENVHGGAAVQQQARDLPVPRAAGHVQRSCTLDEEAAAAFGVGGVVHDRATLQQPPRLLAIWPSRRIVLVWCRTSFVGHLQYGRCGTLWSL